MFKSQLHCIFYFIYELKLWPISKSISYFNYNFVIIYIKLNV